MIDIQKDLSMKRKRTSKFVMEALLPMIVFKVPVEYKVLIR